MPKASKKKNLKKKGPLGASNPVLYQRGVRDYLVSVPKTDLLVETT